VLVLTEGLDQTGMARRGVDGVKRRRGRLGASRRRTSGCAPASWSPRMGSWRPCECEKGVSRLGAATAVS